MNENTPIPCPECDRIKYFEGLCYFCRNRKLREYYEYMDKDQIEVSVENIIAKIETIDDWEGDVYKDINGLLAYQNMDTETSVRFKITNYN